MNFIFEFLNDWKDLITKVYSEYPLPAALFTAAAIVAWFYLDKVRAEKRPSNTLIVFAGWAIGVPIFGGLLWLIGKLVSVLWAVAGTTYQGTSSLFGIYKKHPIMVLSLIALAIATYFAWKRWRPRLIPNKPLRIIALIFGVFLMAHIVEPLLEIFTPQPEVASQPSKPPAAAETPALPATPAPPPANPTAAPAPASVVPTAATPAPSQVSNSVPAPAAPPAALQPAATQPTSPAATTPAATAPGSKP